METVWVIYFSFWAIAISALLIVIFRDDITVFVLRNFDIPAFPTARSIAFLIYQKPQEWSHDRYHMSHPVIGSIWIANEAYGLHVTTDIGDWKPCGVERRIIREAVDWRIKTYVRDRITHAMNRNLLP